MSASLFDIISGSSYESYPTTYYVEGDKKFGELEKGDILYALSKDLDGNYQWEELIITKPWHNSKGYCYISCKRNGKKYNICFGPADCTNVKVDSYNASIIYYNLLIGTNKKSIYNDQYKFKIRELERCRLGYEQQLNDIKSLLDLPAINI